MEKKTFVAFGIIQILFLSSLLIFATGNAEDINTEETPSKLCNQDCVDCDQDCSQDGQCTGEGKDICTGSGRCSTTKSNCQSESTGCRTISCDNNITPNKAYSSTSCSSSCNN